MTDSSAIRNPQSAITVVFRPLFHPGTTERMTSEELQEQIKLRREIIQKHAKHEVVKAFAEMLDLQAAGLTAELALPELDNREHKAGQAFNASYTSAKLQAILDWREPEVEDPENAGT